MNKQKSAEIFVQVRPLLPHHGLLEMFINRGKVLIRNIVLILYRSLLLLRIVLDMKSTNTYTNQLIMIFLLKY